METQIRSMSGVSLGALLRNVFIVVASCLVVTAALKLLNVDGRYAAGGGNDPYTSEDDASWLWLRLTWPLFCRAAIIDYVISRKHRLAALIGINMAPGFQLLSLRMSCNGPCDFQLATHAWFLGFVAVSIIVGSLTIWTFNLYLSSVCLIWPVERIVMAVREALDLRQYYQDKSGLIVAVNAALVFVRGEDAGSDLAFQIRESVAHVYRLNPERARWRYCSQAIGILPRLVFVQIGSELLKWRWSRRLVSRR
jgi:hypothetical protein